VRAAVGTGSELHVVHVVPAVAELPYIHLAAKEMVEDLFEWRRLKGLEVLDEWVRRIGEDLGGTVEASYYREGRPEKEIVLLSEEIDAGLIVIGGRRQAWLERVFGTSLAVLILDQRSSQGTAIPR
jgi:nucleotide-binding universal stress UspA family protein